jgi:hypothetical protein
MLPRFLFLASFFHNLDIWNFLRTLGHVFELCLVQCTPYTFPNAKDYVSTKFSEKIKISVYVNIELDN